MIGLFRAAGSEQVEANNLCMILLYPPLKAGSWSQTVRLAVHSVAALISSFGFMSAGDVGGPPHRDAQHKNDVRGHAGHKGEAESHHALLFSTAVLTKDMPLFGQGSLQSLLRALRQGPEIRTGFLENSSAPVKLTTGKEVTLTTDYEAKGTEDLIACRWPLLSPQLQIDTCMNLATHINANIAIFSISGLVHFWQLLRPIAASLVKLCTDAPSVIFTLALTLGLVPQLQEAGS